MAGSALAVIAQERPTITIDSGLKILNDTTQWQSKKQKELSEIIRMQTEGEKRTNIVTTYMLHLSDYILFQHNRVRKSKMKGSGSDQGLGIPFTEE